MKPGRLKPGTNNMSVSGIKRAIYGSDSHGSTYLKNLLYAKQPKPG
jgi:hypothetical protein